MFIFNHVKPDKRREYERFLNEIFFPALKRSATTDTGVAVLAARDSRVLYPAEPNKDSTFTYAFVMDPMHSGADYSLLNLLKRAYSAAEAERYMKDMFLASVAKSETHVLVQNRYGESR